jgi:hypothetical protein
VPYYQSKTGKKVLIKLGKNQKQIKILPTPQYFPYQDLNLLFPSYIDKISEIGNKKELNIQDLDAFVRDEIIRQTPNSSQEYFLKDSMSTGAWKDQRCFIIGGGPSLKGFDFSKLQGERVIVVNKSFLYTPFADIQFGMDEQLIGWLTDEQKGGKMMEEAREAWVNFKGKKVWVQIPGKVYNAQVELVKLAGHDGLAESLEKGLYDGSNSGYGAINLATALGANPIYLLGFDMKHEADGTTHFHGGYPRPQAEKQLKMFASKFTLLANLAQQRGIKIVNLNRQSALSCFEFGDIDAVLANKQLSSPEDYLIVSFYTPEYERDIVKLEESIWKLKLPNEFQPYSPPLKKGNPLDNWNKNTRYKAKFIKQMMEKHPNKNIVWVDADAIIHENPDLFGMMHEYDIAVHYRDNIELLTGTIFIRNNEVMRKIVSEWDAANQKNQSFLEQRNLQNILFRNTKVRVYKLPTAYCQIFDSPSRSPRAVIEHFQSSRKWRNSRKRKNISLARNSFEIFRDGLWEGQRCFIIGGGKSLTGFDFNRLRGERIITINRAVEYTPFAEIFFSIDSRFYQQLHDPREIFLKPTIEAFKKFEGIKCWLDTPGYPFSNDVYAIKSARGSQITTSLHDGLFSGKNSGFGALNLAVCLKANPIYLLGFDMKLYSGVNHFHQGYGNNYSFNPETKRWAEMFEKNADRIQKAGIKVINLTPDSNLKCFKFDSIDNLKLGKDPNFLVCSFYTRDYKDSALSLKRRLRLLGIPHYIEAITTTTETYKEWQQITFYKAEFIRTMLDKYPDKNIVWTDADSLFHFYPFLFETLTCDISARIYKERLLTGTAFFKNNDATRQIIEKWIKQNKVPIGSFRCTQEQKNLENIIKAEPNFNFQPLPSEYCTIFDEVQKPKNIIVEHYQESRKFREF